MSFLTRICAVGIFGTLSLCGALNQATAQFIKPLNAKDSGPIKIGRMTGYPPPPDKLIMQPESDFFSFPKLRWTVCHIRELMPTKQVSRGIGAPVSLPYAIDNGIEALRFIPMGGDKLMTWEESLSANYTDGILIIHDFQERIRPNLESPSWAIPHLVL